MRLALYQPDIPQNAGTIMRMAACLGVGVDLIEPAGFDVSDRALRRAGLDYLQHLDLMRHASWEAFLASPALGSERPISDVSPIGRRRIVLLTTKAETDFSSFTFEASDTLLVGRESAGVPEQVHVAADARIKIPMRPGMRSLNVAIAAAMVLGEALRQTGGWAGDDLSEG